MMSDRLACDLCGCQPCACVEAECRACEGEGKVVHPHWQPPYASRYAESPPDPPLVTCEDCGGAGWIKCDGPRAGGRCKFAPPPGIPGDYHCYCETAWERQQEAIASEPPPSVAEQHRRAWEEREALRSGRVL